MKLIKMYLFKFIVPSQQHTFLYLFVKLIRLKLNIFKRFKLPATSFFHIDKYLNEI